LVAGSIEDVGTVLRRTRSPVPPPGILIRADMP
jgi:hypothetical protein